MKKQQRYLYVVSPGGLGCTAFFGTYEIEHLQNVPEADAVPLTPSEARREGLNLNWIQAAVRLPFEAGRKIQKRLLRRASNASAAA